MTTCNRHIPHVRCPWIGFNGGTPGMVHLAPVPVGMEVVGVCQTHRAVTKPRARCWTYAEKAKRKRAIKLK